MRKMKIWLLAAVLLVIILFGTASWIRDMSLQVQNGPLNTGKTMKDLKDELVPGQIPAFFQYDSRWKSEPYGDGTMELNGCGPTCLSMVICGLQGNVQYDPVTVARMADEGGYYEEGAGSLWTLMSEGAEKFGLQVHEVRFDEEHIRQELLEGRPIICVVGPGDFTTTGHFIVLCGVDSSGQVIVHDPNSVERSRKTWEIEEIMPQIKNLWAYS